MLDQSVFTVTDVYHFFFCQVTKAHTILRNIPSKNDMRFFISYTLKRNKITSPSLTTYSFPSMPTIPFSRAAARLPLSKRS